MDHTDVMSQYPSSKEKMMSYCYTWVKEHTFNFKWTIQNLEYCLSIHSLTSPEFSDGIKNDLLWYLHIETIYHSGKTLKIQLFRKDHNDTSKYAKFKLSIVNNKGEIKNIYETTGAKKCEPDQLFHFVNYDYKNFFNEANGYLLNGILTLFCKVTVVDMVNSEFCTDRAPKCSLVKDLENVFKEQKFCDITFSVGGREFKAHKNILSGRSPVFAAMFNHEFVESIQKSVTITDVDHEVFEEILRFMYTGQSKKIESMADKLLIAADKYALEKLKVICEEVLCNKISIDNVCDFLILADKYSVNHLKVQTMEFIKNHFGNVKNTVGWVNVKDSYLYSYLLIPMFERYLEEISLV